MRNITGRMGLLLLCVVILPSCCPSGVWEDNFGFIYQLFTVQPGENLVPWITTGVMDTGEMACGIWKVRNLRLRELPVAPGTEIAFIAQNENPNPTDHCCYAFRFEGNPEDGDCFFVTGTYWSVGGKCQQSGPMYLDVIR